MARYWFEAAVSAMTFEFNGRTATIGAIQTISGSATTTWMDEIIAPSPRRQARLDQLRHPTDMSSQPDKLECLSSSDKDWVALHSQLATEAARVMRFEIEDCARERE
ncbi:MAG: hypothetical protein M1813_001753 [Trichoglossum hirsutum]|nr:MAG: hypothetical protein M1813_001753 [Trichoglossum hirsutum]